MEIKPLPPKLKNEIQNPLGGNDDLESVFQIVQRNHYERSGAILLKSKRLWQINCVLPIKCKVKNGNSVQSCRLEFLEKGFNTLSYIDPPSSYTGSTLSSIDPPSSSTSPAPSSIDPSSSAGLTSSSTAALSSIGSTSSSTGSTLSSARLTSSSAASSSSTDPSSSSAAALSSVAAPSSVGATNPSPTSPNSKKKKIKKRSNK
ncbi:hypothetical protein ACTA71_006484 [Dictyostelium dimigraforme]